MNFYPTHPNLPGSYISYDDSVVLPPDEATVSMARAAAVLVGNTKLAQKLYVGEDAVPTVLDLGSGSGVEGSVVLESLTDVNEVRAVDIDPRTFRYAKQNIHRANYRRTKRSLARATLAFMVGDWNDPAVWEASSPADLTICNPPYLALGESVRPGYERTPVSHLYLPNSEAVAETYTTILGHCLDRMRQWDVVVMRLPVAIEGTDAGLWCHKAIDVLAHRPNVSEDSWYSVRTYRARSRSSRPAHVLTLEKLPLDYPAISVHEDARIDKFRRTGRDPGILNVGRRRQPNETLLISDVF